MAIYYSDKLYNLPVDVYQPNIKPTQRSRTVWKTVTYVRGTEYRLLSPKQFYSKDERKVIYHLPPHCSCLWKNANPLYKTNTFN